MSESSAKSANTNLSVFSFSGTNNSDQQNEVAVLMASGMNVDEALNLLLQEQATFGGSHAAVTTQPSGGSPAAVTMGPSGGSLAAVPNAPPGIPQILDQPDALMTFLRRAI